MKRKIDIQRKNTNIKRIVCLVVPFFLIGNSYAQKPRDTCSYDRYDVSPAKQYYDDHIPFAVGDDPPATPSDTGYRNIFFIHGLGGDATAWSNVADACQNEKLKIQGFPARKCTTHRLSYVDDTKATVWAAAAHTGVQIRTLSDFYLRNYNINPERGIIIAHSQGGIVTRALMNLDFDNNAILPPFGRGYGGVITVASPLQGAMILNNRHLLRNMADDACNRLLAGPMSSMLASKLMEYAFGGLQSACSTATGPVLNFFVSHFYDSITAAYTVGSPLIDMFNSDANNPNYCSMPKIAISPSQHNDNIMWRALNWFVNNPNNYGHFGATEAHDYKFYYDYVDTAYKNYKAKVVEFDNKYKECRDGFIVSIVGGVLTGWIFVGAGGITTSVLMGDYYLDRKNAYQKGVNWIDKANDDWLTVIGASEYIQGPYEFWKSHVSDGVVLKKSSSDLPCATWAPLGTYTSSTNGKRTGSTHMQIRNDDKIKEILNATFNGLFDKFFATPQK